jgi:hypothetical protein
VPRSLVVLPAVTLLLTVAAAAPVPKQAKPPLYFPTKVGSKWVYQAGDKEWAEVVTKVEETAEGTLVTVAIELPGGKLSEYKKVLLSEKGVFSVYFHGKLDPPRVALKFPLTPGEEYAKPDPKAGTSTRTTFHGHGRVEVPAGVYEAVRVDSEQETIDGVRRVQVWYAPGIGLIKSGEVGKPGLVLKSFTPGKD